jgi:hypothetical protein
LSNKTVLVLIVVCIVLAIGCFSSVNIAYRQKLARDKEMMARLEIEEKMSTFAQRDKARDEEVESMRKQLDQERQSHETTKKTLVSEQVSKQTLQEEVLRLATEKMRLQKTLAEENATSVVTEGTEK